MNEDEARELLNHDPEIKARIAASHELLEHLMPIAVEGQRLVDLAGQDQLASIAQQQAITSHLLALSHEELLDLAIAAINTAGGFVYYLVVKRG